MSKWRPEGWDYTYSKVADKVPFFDAKSLADPTIYEAGANAMLEALRNYTTYHLLEIDGHPAPLKLECLIPQDDPEI